MTGQAIIKAILAGQHDPHKLAELRDPRVQASHAEIAKHLEGNWQEGLLFVLKQEQEAYEFCLQQMAECDRQLEQYLQQREDRSPGGLSARRDPQGQAEEEQEREASVRLACRVVSHDRYGSNPD
jgi:transposase